MTVISIDRHDRTLRATLAWLKKNKRLIESFEGVIVPDANGGADISGWLPPYNSGVYLVGQMHECPHEDCEGLPHGPDRFVTCYPYVKIGIAEDVYTRFASLQSSCPQEVEALALLPIRQEDRRRVERELHALFAPYRLTGRRTEWFHNNAAMQLLIEEVVAFGGELAR
jgi:hypothetical protein